MKTNNYNKLVCTQVKELFRTCFTKENLALFDLWELIDISNLCKQVAEEADKTFDEITLNEISKMEFNEPMQVELEGDGYSDGELVYDYGKCPKCGWEFEESDKDWEEPYCCHCGQRLHWFDEQMEGE